MTKHSIAIWIFFIFLPQSLFAGERENNPYVQCVEGQMTKDVDTCLEKVGRIEWWPYKSPDSCIVNKEILEVADKNEWKLSWKVLFMNERCRRLGEPFYKREGQP